MLNIWRVHSTRKEGRLAVGKTYRLDAKVLEAIDREGEQNSWPFGRGLTNRRAELVMSVNVVCSCGRMMKAPSSAAGKRGRCKACGAILDIPPPANVGPEANEDIALAITLDDPSSPRPAPPPLPDTVVGEADNLGALIGIKTVPRRRLADGDDSPVPSLPGEPWYYRWLDLIGTIGAFLAVAGFCIGMAAGIILVLAFGGRDDEAGRFSGAPGVMVIVSTVAATLPLFIWGMIMKLMVDAARNLRALRYARD